MTSILKRNLHNSIVAIFTIYTFDSIEEIFEEKNLTEKVNDECNDQNDRQDQNAGSAFQSPQIGPSRIEGHHQGKTSTKK